MFIRKKINKSGSTSVQILNKINKKNILVRTIGCACDSTEINKLLIEAEQYLSKPQTNQLSLLSLETRESGIVSNFLQGLSNSNIRAIGPELIFGTLFDRIGFNKIREDLFRHITIARLAYPTSKLKTVDYLYRYRGITVDEDQIYRFLDKFHKKYKEDVERIAYEYTKDKLKNITVVFYDMTTLYFEAEDEDDLRKIGFSKDGKFQQPQIMVGLLVGENGLPIGYDIFEGNTFEGKTLLPVLNKIKDKYGFDKPIVVADSGLLSKENMKNLANEKYEFILGARIKNETNEVKEKILKSCKELKDGESVIITKSDGLRLIVGYSTKRSRKDMYNREKGLRKLREKIKHGKLTKDQINNRGYNKFLILENKVEVSLDESKVNEDVLWDGLKGYITNTPLHPDKIIGNYKHLWQIEKAFRISKTDLRIRPIYHRKKDRIEAHLCIAFVAYTIYKELEQLLYKNKSPF